ncbi:hypothetical protein BDA96_02G223500 [Sorghum bicolor]|uniref:Uncharacterized protein n=2 Tax=Sorghum bicolor TaxID=4558 RepID=A0A921UWA2_SORBI|nr:hypothetical protein BDA96_02G223500 [Sorghum bicolor]KXG35697.1 hypothetical protein SORBI_3002G213000 [Sorghum bicolor]
MSGRGIARPCFLIHLGSLYSKIIVTITILLCSRIGFLRVFTYDAEENYHMFFSAGTENYFVIAINVVVDSYARCLIMSEHSSMIFVGPWDYCPIFASLRAIRDEMRNFACYNDQIKIALSARANEVKRLEYEECAAMSNNQGVISYVNGCNIEEVDEEVFVIKH